MELLESVGPRPRQARYQAALRPDMKCCRHSKALSNIAATPIGFYLACAELFLRSIQEPPSYCLSISLIAVADRRFILSLTA